MNVKDEKPKLDISLKKTKLRWTRFVWRADYILIKTSKSSNEKVNNVRNRN